MTTPREANGTSLQTRMSWQDTRLILLMRGLRQLAYGLLAVLLGVALVDEGFSPLAIGSSPGESINCSAFAI